MLVKNRNRYYWYGEEITQIKYDEILSMLHNRPTAPDGYAYRLTTGLEWELYELPATDGESEVSAEEALAEILEVLI